MSERRLTTAAACCIPKGGCQRLQPIAESTKLARKKRRSILERAVWLWKNGQDIGRRIDFLLRVRLYHRRRRVPALQIQAQGRHGPGTVAGCQ